MILFLYATFCLGLALYNYDRINRSRRIYHGVNGLIHLTAAFLVTVLSGWQDGVTILLLARLVFDISLNAMRGKGLDYISPEVKRYKSIWEATRKGKWVDYIEYKKFGNNGYLPKIIYLIGIICLQILK